MNPSETTKTAQEKDKLASKEEKKKVAEENIAWNLLSL